MLLVTVQSLQQSIKIAKSNPISSTGAIHLRSFIALFSLNAYVEFAGPLSIPNYLPSYGKFVMENVINRPISPLEASWKVRIQ